MFGDFQFWRMLAGIGLFLFAMAQLEAALRAVGGRSLSEFLRERTGTPIRAVLSGTVATAILQSSSVVGLMVLAFVGAGLLSLKNALGVVFGSNLGTTFTGWIVATLGFKFEIIELSLPLIGVGALLFVVAHVRLSSFGRFLLGLGLLLLGMQFMKESVASLGEAFDVTRLGGLASWQYLLFGAGFAALIRSSSATMMITLAALAAGTIDLPSAAAVAIGADLGTTTTVLIGAIQGASGKKRVALAHFLFNVVTDAIAFVLRVPLLAVVAAVGIRDPLYALVAFHSLFNLIGIVLFLPFISPFARFLESRFAAEPEMSARYLSGVSPSLTDAAMRAIERETARLIHRVITHNMRAFHPPIPLPPGRPPVPGEEEPLNFRDRAFEDSYSMTKRLEGEIIAFATRLQAQPLDEAASQRLTQLLSAVREAVHSSKLLKDIRHNLDDFSASINEPVRRYLDHFRSVMTSFYDDLYGVRRSGQETIDVEDLVDAIQEARRRHDQMHREIYISINEGRLRETEISSLLNVNRETLNSNLALLMALRDFHLEASEAETVRQLPGVG
ncbi:MAG: Na/Pi cotransporter family protein [Gammaproteobacteria bacterium]|nr:Na/Pi cotransporter family protein [Gammaproteobacteria bacterium]